MANKIKQNPAQSASYTKKADKQEKAKPVGDRYTDKLAKKLGKSKFAKPTKKDAIKYDGRGVYNEKRKDKSDISLKNKFEMGGEFEEGGDTYAKGGKIKQNPAQSASYTKKADKQEKAKPVGDRYTDKLAKKLGKSKFAKPTKKDAIKYDGRGVYNEKRKDKSDISLKNKFEDGGTPVVVEIAVEQMKEALGREPKYPYDFMEGKKYVKCFLRPYYKCVE